MNDQAAATAQGQETIVGMDRRTLIAQLRQMVEAGRARRDPTLAIAVSVAALGALLDQVDHAGHRTAWPHDCFATNCKDLGPEVLRRLGDLQRLEADASTLLARIVDAAGGTVVVPDKALVDDTPELVVSDDPIAGARTYRTLRRPAESVTSQSPVQTSDLQGMPAEGNDGPLR